MTEKERFQRAFAPLHASPDTMTEVMKMTEQKTKRPALRRAATIGLAAALVLALGSVAYASDLGGIQRTVQLWLNGEMTDATLTVKNGHYTVNYTDSEGNERGRCSGRGRTAPVGGRSRSTPPAAGWRAAAFRRSAGPCCRPSGRGVP